VSERETRTVDQEHTRIGAEQRARLARLAEELIPEGEGMPSAGAAEVAGTQLDKVLQVRPDLSWSLLRALASEVDSPAESWLQDLERRDPEAHEAVVLAILGGYYLHPAVRERLGYRGQRGEELRSDEYLEYVTEGLLDPVIERGPIFRDPGDDSSGDTPR
jgi:hypothetical protein